MAKTSKTGVALKLTYDMGLVEDKQVFKTRTLKNIRLDATEDQLLDFAKAMLSVQARPATVAKLDTTEITA